MPQSKEAISRAKRAYYVANREKLIAKVAARRRENIEKHRARNREWKRKNKELNRTYSAVWRKANPERSRELVRSWHKANPERMRQLKRAWAEKNVHKYRAWAAGRKAALRSRVPLWADKSAISAFYDEAARLTRATGVRHEVDHIIPIRGRKVSGLHVETNLRVISQKENSVKHNRFEVTA